MSKSHMSRYGPTLSLAIKIRELLSPHGLKLARPLLRPSFDHDFLFGVELDCIAPLAMHNSQEAVLPTAEWKVGHWRGHADVDTNIAGLHLVTEFACGRAAAW